MGRGEWTLQQQKTRWYPQPVFHTKKFINKHGDPQMGKLIIKLTIY